MISIYDYNALKMTEGIDIDLKSKTISFNNTHEDIIDTSLDNNPTSYTVGNSKVYSVFKRKDSFFKMDANPLVYALKGKNDWKINKEDEFKIWNRFNEIILKLNNDFDYIVVLPSSNNLNAVIAKHISKWSKKIILPTKIQKHTVEEVSMSDIWTKLDDKETDSLKNSLSKMNGDFFEMKHVSASIRSKLSNIFKIEFDDEVSTKVLDKRVIVIDDTISSGSSISFFIDTFKDNYNCEIPYCITMFGKLK